jgi:hypothetical protein
MFVGAVFRFLRGDMESFTRDEFLMGESTPRP